VVRQARRIVVLAGVRDGLRSRHCVAELAAAPQVGDDAAAGRVVARPLVDVGGGLAAVEPPARVARASVACRGLHLLARRIFISSQTGNVKPSPAAYVQILEQASPGDHLLYVDDKDANVEAFRSLGVDGVLADRAGAWTSAVDAWLGTSSRRTR
jgi:hypothetical protein